MTVYTACCILVLIFWWYILRLGRLLDLYIHVLQPFPVLYSLCRDIDCEISYTVYGYPQWITAQTDGPPEPRLQETLHRRETGERATPDNHHTPAINEGCTRSLRISHTSSRAPLQPVPKTQVPCTPYPPPNLAGVVQ